MPCTELGVWNIAMGQTDVAVDLMGFYLGAWVGGGTDNTQAHQ